MDRGLRASVEAGVERGLLLAMSDGASETEQAYTPSDSDHVRWPVLAWWQASRRGAEPTVPSELADLIGLLQQSTLPSDEVLATAMKHQPASVQSQAWFVAWQLSGEPRHLQRARNWSTPGWLPVALTSTVP